MVDTERDNEVTLQRIARFQQQVAHLQSVETHPESFRACASGYLAEIDRMQSEIQASLSERNEKTQ